MRFKIAGIGSYLPSQRVPSTEIDSRLGLTPGTTEKKTGVRFRHYVQDEGVADMAKEAAVAALKNAGIKAQELDLIIAAGASPIQIIPCNAVFIHRALGLEESGIPAFDIDATCLSFLAALDVVSSLMASGRYRRILVVTSELASRGLNRNDAESYALFGDAAVACVFEAADGAASDIQVLGRVFQTYSSGADLCRIVGGGSVLPGYEFNKDNHEDYLFTMDGPKIFKLSARRLPEMLERLLAQSEIRQEQIDLVVPHQASLSAMTLIRRRLGFAEEQWLQIIDDYGNCIAASIPLGLEVARQRKLIKPGSIVLLLGTGAGLSVAATLLKF